MKANQKFLNDRAEVGVGTLIVFIAMVLVAAVAAAVLINTTGTLQQRAQSTGKEATQEVSSNLKVLNIYGARNASTDIWKLQINVELSAGALPMDLTKLVIRYSDGTNTPENYIDVNTAKDWIRGDGANDVMVAGDLVELEIELADPVQPRTSIEVSLIPETGSPVQADFKTPSTYGSDAVITLR
jgi:archaeal flagellin FlaB